MPKVFLINRHRKFLLRAGIMTLAGLLGQSVFAVCPNIDRRPDKNIGEVDLPNISGSETISFCKQEFDPKDQKLSYKPNPSVIVEGGSQNISMGSKSKIQNFPLGMSINLEGFTPSDLNLKNSILTAYFPNVGGFGGSPSLFNFYTGIALTKGCENALRGGNQYELIKGHLRDNAYRFQANSGKEIGVRVDDNPNDIAIIKGVKVTESQSGKFLTADITLYHANTTGQQYFRRTFPVAGYLCWVGVGAKMEIKIDNLKSINAGDYVVNIDVVTD